VVEKENTLRKDIVERDIPPSELLACSGQKVI
jgi:hypothetical protein